MNFTITHVLGDMERNPSVEELSALIAELDTADDEHPDVAINLEDGWTLSAFRNGSVVLENLEEGEPRHLRSVSRERIVTLMKLLASGGADAVAGEPWESGYPR